jgi:predicted nucleic acid-binding protein
VDDLWFAEAVEFAGMRLVGHQQVTDAYLLGLAIHRGGMLATLDRGIEALSGPKGVERKAIEIVG